MNITSFVEESPTKRSIHFEIPAEEVGTATQLVARELARHLRLPGFRPGKVPVDVVKRKFGDELKSELVESLVKDALNQVIAERKLAVVGQPRVEDVKLEDGQPMTFHAHLEIRPEVDPKEYRGLKVPTESTEVGEEEIAAMMDRFREARATYEAIDDRPAQDGDFALVDIHGSFPGGDGQDFDREKLLVEVGGDQTLPELSAHLRNAEAGVSVTFQKDFPADASDPEFAGKTVLYNVQLHALKKRVLPELDDELAQKVLTPRDGEPPEGAGLEMLRKQVSLGIRREKEGQLREKRRRAALDGLLALNPVEAPEMMVEAQIDSSVEEYARFLARQGVDLKEAKLDWAKVRGEFREGAVKKVKEYLLLDAIGEKEGIVVSDTELDAELKREAARMGGKLSELKASLVKADRLEGIREDLRIAKVVEFLLAEAVAAG